MSSCCTDTAGGCKAKPATVSPGVCKGCGKKGLPIDAITLEALSTPDALRHGVPRNPRFCPTADCPVVYFDPVTATEFTESDVIVRVHAKHPHDEDVPVCYCFEHSPGTIRREIEQTGNSTASKLIMAEVNAGHCACEVRNPKGSCCLGDVARAEREMKTCLEASNR